MITKVFVVLTIPSAVALIIALASVLSKEYENFFTSWVTILEAFALMFGSYVLMICYKDVRLDTPHRHVIVVI